MLVCTGPGRRTHKAVTRARRPPDCGHTYRRSSAGESDGAFGVSAIVTWVVTWQGDGQLGSLPAHNSDDEHLSRRRVASDQHLRDREPMTSQSKEAM